MTAKVSLEASGLCFPKEKEGPLRLPGMMWTSSRDFAALIPFHLHAQSRLLILQNRHRWCRPDVQLSLQCMFGLPNR
jgi:hypothetical protein